MTSRSGRRSFLAANGAGLLILKPETVFGSQANTALEIGLIGCGARGNMIGGMFKEYAGARLVALHDPFENRLEFTKGNLKTPNARTYKGLEGYKDLVASKLDAAAWTLNAAPVKAYGTGGREVRMDGDCWDHFAVTYWYPGNLVVDFSSTWEGRARLRTSRRSWKGSGRGICCTTRRIRRAAT